MSGEICPSRGKIKKGVLTSEGINLGEANEVNRYHLRPKKGPKSLVLKGSSGKPTYGTLPLVLMVDSELSSSAKILWIYLNFRQGNNETAWPSQSTIEAHTCLSRSTISRATQELERLKWLKVFRTTAGTQRWNSYRVNIPDYAISKINSTSKKKPQVPQNEELTDSNRFNTLIQIDAVKTPMLTSNKNSITTSHQSRLVPDYSSIFRSINE